jgi:hypothetical protein
MKVHRCHKCGKRGGYLVFRQTKSNVVQKYPYVGHYDILKKSKRRWCSLNAEQLDPIESPEDWYQIDYRKLIEEAQTEYKKHGKNQKSEDNLVKAAQLLEEHGFVKPYNYYKVGYNVTHFFITEKFIEDILPDEYNDKSKK